MNSNSQLFLDLESKNLMNLKSHKNINNSKKLNNLNNSNDVKDLKIFKNSKSKILGQVYTPNFIVKNILDIINYKNNNLTKKHIIDNSSGDGAFLIEIVKRYCEYNKDKISDIELKKDLETYIHGIEKDKIEYEKCIKNLDNIVKEYNLKNVNWDIKNNNTLFICEKYYNKMDFVVGNPPYIRVHNLDKDSYNKVKGFNFSKGGMTDIYIVFFEIGINMLNPNGKLGYITPSSYFNSLAGKALRYYLEKYNLLEKIINLKHFQVFNATTYTAITILSKINKTKSIKYYEYDETNLKERFIDNLRFNDFFINDNYYFSGKKSLKWFKSIINYNKTKFIEIKNGFATLKDKFFIKDKFDFKSEYIIDIYKASTGLKKQCLFPYKNFNLVDYNILIKNENLKKYYQENKEILINRDLENKDKWWGFGRTQGIKDIYREKYSINSLLKTLKDLKVLKCSSGVGVYSGLYIIGNISLEKIKSMLNENFILYISILGKYKSGGYYTYSSKDLSLFLNYQLYIEKYGSKIS